MNEVLYQEEEIQRMKESFRANPRKYLFPDPTDENTDYRSFRIQKSALISTRPRFLSAEVVAEHRRNKSPGKDDEIIDCDDSRDEMEDVFCTPSKENMIQYQWQTL